MAVRSSRATGYDGPKDQEDMSRSFQSLPFLSSAGEPLGPEPPPVAVAQAITPRIRSPQRGRRRVHFRRRPRLPLLPSFGGAHGSPTQPYSALYPSRGISPQLFRSSLRVLSTSHPHPCPLLRPFLPGAVSFAPRLDTRLVTGAIYSFLQPRKFVFRRCTWFIIGNLKYSNINWFY